MQFYYGRTAYIITRVRQRASSQVFQDSVLEAVESPFGENIDYSMIVKIYGAADAEKRYSPAKCLGSIPQDVTGNPDPEQYLDQLRGAPEPDDADVDVAVSPV